ncbi:hypothetical protein OS493_019545 [Desmophyllum pertusum]|uniref:Uncharacterized protein n=1 Tax=Desmophyllum pertusum TaxID=174260 RepID=A0A9X0D2J6_9CNID|nr:hypothetical protein OS493_019545 [Desmophyllum pertusum]
MCTEYKDITGEKVFHVAPKQVSAQSDGDMNAIYWHRFIDHVTSKPMQFYDTRESFQESLNMKPISTFLVSYQTPARTLRPVEPRLQAGFVDDIPPQRTTLCYELCASFGMATAALQKCRLMSDIVMDSMCTSYNRQHLE